jgi:hypothetical protein
LAAFAAKSFRGISVCFTNNYAQVPQQTGVLLKQM